MPNGGGGHGLRHHGSSHKHQPSKRSSSSRSQKPPAPQLSGIGCVCILPVLRESNTLFLVSSHKKNEKKTWACAKGSGRPRGLSRTTVDAARRMSNDKALAGFARYHLNVMFPPNTVREEPLRLRRLLAPSRGHLVRSDAHPHRIHAVRTEPRL